MSRFNISALSLALLGSLALAGCNDGTGTADVDTSTPANTAATEPVIDDTNTPADNSFGDTGELGDTSTMGDVNSPYEDPALAPQPDPNDPARMNDATDPQEPLPDNEPQQ
jgi:hypothetical protein